MARYSAQERRQLARRGAAMKDGSFPIISATDLENAIHLVGNANDPEAAKRHIVKRARALMLKGHLPVSWL